MNHCDMRITPYIEIISIPNEMNKQHIFIFRYPFGDGVCILLLIVPGPLGLEISTILPVGLIIIRRSTFTLPYCFVCTSGDAEDVEISWGFCC